MIFLIEIPIYRKFCTIISLSIFNECDIFSDDILKTLDIIRTMVKNNQDLDNKLNETLKSFIKENL